MAYVESPACDASITQVPELTTVSELLVTVHTEGDVDEVEIVNVDVAAAMSEISTVSPMLFAVNSSSFAVLENPIVWDFLVKTNSLTPIDDSYRPSPIALTRTWQEPGLSRVTVPFAIVQWPFWSLMLTA